LRKLTNDGDADGDYDYDYDATTTTMMNAGKASELKYLHEKATD